MSDQLRKPPRRLPISLAPTASVPIVLGIAACAVGFGLIAYCWSQVALRTIVADQMAYVVSSGFTGLGLIVVGVMVAAIQVRRRDAEQQFRRLERLVFTASGRRGAPPRTKDDDEAKATVGARSATVSGIREAGGARSAKASLTDPRVSALVTSAVAVLVGFVLIGFSWFRVSDEPSVAVQVPYVVSGGIVGLALVGAGCAFAYVLFSRGMERRRNEVVADLVGAVSRSGRPGRGSA